MEVPIVPRGRRPGSNISTADAQQILQDLIRAGKIKSGSLAKAVCATDPGLGSLKLTDFYCKH